jgi:serine/threonine protein kinase
VISAQIIDCLIYLHSKGVIYGDLKAENILISHNGTIKLCDFNLSGTQSILSTTLQGTLCYLSPEMIEGSKRTPKSDFWSLGVLMHLIYYRCYPFKNKGTTHLLHNIINVKIVKEPSNRKASRDFKKLIRDLLVKNPKRRLGDRIEDFQQHPFYKKLDWSKYFRDKNSFFYAKDYADNEGDRNSSSSSDEGLMADSEEILKCSKGTNYNIEGFTYENSQSKDCNLRNNDIEINGKRQ